MAAEVVGTAFVRIKAITTGLSKDIEKGVQKGVKDANVDKPSAALGKSISEGAAPEMEKGLKKAAEGVDLDGTSGGKNFGDTFTDSSGKSISSGLKKNLSDFDGTDSGKKLGGNFGDSATTEIGKRFKNLVPEISRNIDPEMENLNRDLTAKLEGIGDRLKLFKKLKVDKDFAKVTVKDLDRLFRNEEPELTNVFSRFFANSLGRANVGKSGDSAGNVFTRFFSRALGAAIPDTGKQGTQHAKSFGDRFVAGLKKTATRLGLVLAPSIATITSFVTQYVVALVGQVGLLVEAVAGAGVAMSAAFASVGTAILPLLVAFKVQTPALKRFQKLADDTGKAWQEFGESTQEFLLPGLSAALINTKKLIPIFSNYGREVGRVTGRFAEHFSQVLTGAESQRRLTAIFDGSIPILETFFRILEDVGDILSSLWEAALPAAQMFADDLERVVQRWADVVNAGRESGALGATLTDWYEKTRLVFGALGDLFGALWDILSVGSDAAVPFFENFATWAEEFRTFTESAAGQNKLRQIFDDAMEVAHEFNGLIVDIARRIGGGIFEEGGNEGMLTFIATLRDEVVPFLDSVLRPLIEDLGPQLTEFFVAFTGMITAMGETGAIDVTIQLLTLFTEALTGLLNIPGMDKFAGSILGIATALGVLKFALPGFVTKPIGTLFGWLSRLAGAKLLVGIQALGPMLGTLGTAIGVFAINVGALVGGGMIAGFGIIIAAIAAVAAAAYLLYRNWGTVMEAFRAVGRFFKDPMARLERLGELLSDLGGWIVDRLAAAFTALPGIIGDALGAIGGAIGDALSAALQAVPGLLQGALRLIILGILASLFGLPLLIMKGLSILGPFLVDAFTAAFDWLVNTLPGIIGGVLSFVARIPGMIGGALLGIGGIILGALSKVPGIIVDVLSEVPGLIADALGGLGSLLTDLPGIILDALGGLAEAIGGFFSDLDIPGMAGDAFGAIGETIGDAVGDFGGVAGDVISEFLDVFGELPGQVLDVVTEIPGAIGGFLADAIPAALRGLRTAFVTAMQVAIGGLFVAFAGVPILLFKAGQAIGPKLVELFTAAFNFLAAALPQAASAVVTWFAALPQKILTGLMRLGELILGAFSAAWTFVTQQLPALIAPVITWFVGLPVEIWNALVTLGDQIQAAFGAAWNALYAWLTGTAAPAVLNFFIKLPGRIFSALGTLAQTIRNAFTTAIESGKAAVSKGIEGILDFFRKLPGRITALAGSILRAAKEIGGKIVSGLGQGLSAVAGFIGDIAGSVKRALEGAINDLIDLINDGIPDSLGWGPAKINIPDNPIPHINLAQGGIFDQATAALVGEAGREVVIPLTKPKRALELFIKSGLGDVLARAQSSSTISAASPGVNGAGAGGVVISFEHGSIIVQPPMGMTQQQAEEVGEGIVDGMKRRLAERSLAFTTRTG